MASKAIPFANPCWYGEYLDAAAWRNISYATASVVTELPEDWYLWLRGQYVYYFPENTTREDALAPDKDFLQDAGFADVRYVGEFVSDTPAPNGAPALSPRQLELLQHLLVAGEHSDLVRPNNVERCMVVTPRTGMVSPWASKAHDILRNCGLSDVAHLERARLIEVRKGVQLSPTQWQQLYRKIFDPMLEELWEYEARDSAVRGSRYRPAMRTVPVQTKGMAAIKDINTKLTMGLSTAEMKYLWTLCRKRGTDLTDAEMMMFAQLNSEHCRHKLFNAQLAGTGSAPDSLFAMIKNTAKCAPLGVALAYSDNAAVIVGPPASITCIEPKHQRYHAMPQKSGYWVMKVETHNHPTAISPFSGAGTGVGGEIRDEAAVGRGSHSCIGMSGYSVSYLRVPGFVWPWEARPERYPKTVRSALDIMLAAPLGAATFANEFGRPNVCGYFRSFSARARGQSYGYHKPVMLAGGVGRVAEAHIHATRHNAATDAALKLVVLGGPSLLVGLGGGANSSSSAGDGNERMSYASVQRQNPQMQRRCQEVIDCCTAMGERNPIVRIHDVGGGGLANAIPELLRELKCGGVVTLDAVPSADPALSPMELWCNESQERFVLALKAGDIKMFDKLCARERCSYAVVGETNNSDTLLVRDVARDMDVVNMPLEDLFSGVPRLQLKFPGKPASSAKSPTNKMPFAALKLADACARVLSHPTVASKDFLINIADRTVGGLVCRDQMVGRWQEPVADSAVSCADYTTYSGVAMAVGERAPIAVWDALASVRMAVGEALTNIASNTISDMSDIKLSVNWMAAADDSAERAHLMRAVRDLGMELCPQLGLAVVVGKDSLSMRTRWDSGTWLNQSNTSHLSIGGNTHKDDLATRLERSGAHHVSHDVLAPLTAVVTAVAPIADVRTCKTPDMKWVEDTHLLLIDLGRGQMRMGGACLTEVYTDLLGDLRLPAPNLDNPADMRGFMEAMRLCYENNLVVAYHDRSDGGLFACLVEMCLAGHTGADIELRPLVSDQNELMRMLFNEELGAVVQVKASDIDAFRAHFAGVGLADCVLDIGKYSERSDLRIFALEGNIFAHQLRDLHQLWREPSLRIRTLRDNTQCILEERDGNQLFDTDAGIFFAFNFDHKKDINAPYVNLKRPRLAVLREQGINGHYEMAAAFDRAGFEAVDVHTSDVFSGAVRLDQFNGMAVAGGFSYGDVLGAGRGWAQSILQHKRGRAECEAFFARPDTFTLGVCNGCQMLNALRKLIPGSRYWPDFMPNLSGRFEARLCMVELLRSTSILFREMEGAFLPVPIAHGEGRVQLDDAKLHALERHSCVSMRYVCGMSPAVRYPHNPNGSINGIAGVSSEDGRVTLMMPHPERVFRHVQYSWASDALEGHSPWLRMFRNARYWVANN